VLDEFLDRIIAALCLALDLHGVSLASKETTAVRTLPSEALVTKPVTPMLLACFCVYDLAKRQHVMKLNMMS
jgi:hypothetical protein